jgi:hypothetical protein
MRSDFGNINLEFELMALKWRSQTFSSLVTLLLLASEAHNH